VHVSIDAIFNLKVNSDDDAILKAYEHFGDSTFNLQESSIIHSQLEGALREAAATMTLDELQEKRADFSRTVSETLSKHLSDCGLILHNVSIQVLTQADPTTLDPSDIFGARTKALTAAEVQVNRIKENEAVRNSEIAIAAQDVETQKRMFELAVDQENKRVEMEKQKIEFESQRQIAIAQAQAQQEQESQQAIINKDIAVQKKRKEELEAKEITFKALQNANEAETSAETVKAKAIATRNKEIGIIETEKEMESYKLRITKKAEAEKESILALADADLEKTKKQAEAIKVLAAAKKEDYEVEAEGRKKLNEAENTLSIDVIKMKISTKTIENAAAIIKEMVKPIESVDSINIVHAPGLIGGSSGSGSDQANESLPNQVVNAAMKYKYNSAFSDKLLGNIGLDLNNPSRILDSLAENLEHAVTPAEDVQG
jgi:uncharacterized membrane protein YqiK